MPELKRLHISPFDPTSLPTVLSAQLLDRTSNVSFHKIQTFPEKNYGYIDLPAVDADKLRKKLNGSILRGLKMRVEEARARRSIKDQDTQVSTKNDSNFIKKSRKKKDTAMEDRVMSGAELPKERKVKRGWTEAEEIGPENSKRRKGKVDQKSKLNTASITGRSECLFKTSVPPSAVNRSGAPSSEAVKAKKRKTGESDRGIVVHEFANTTKHASFLRDESGGKSTKSASEYIEGKGWVDDEGNVIEAAPNRRRTRAQPDNTDQRGASKPKKAYSRKLSTVDVPSVEVTSPKTRRNLEKHEDDDTSSSGTSDSSSDSNIDTPSSPIAQESIEKPTLSRKRAGLGLTDVDDGGLQTERVERLSITRFSATPPPPPKTQPTSAPTKAEVHPLEALFKRPNNAASDTPKKPHLELSTSFNFFDPDADEGENTGLLMPQTPFTQQDIRQRRQRSAAPTPDTAAPGKTFGNVWGDVSDISSGQDEEEGEGEEEEEEGEEEEEDKETPKAKEKESHQATQEEPESEFSKWFWQHRGENNRAWKRRRREAAKEKRQMDNKERKR